VTFGVTFVTFYGTQRLGSLKKIFLDPQSLTNSGVLRKCPTWDIIPTSLFESMTDIFRLSWNLQNTDLRAREEDYGLFWPGPILSPTWIWAHQIADKATQNLEIVSKNHSLKSFNNSIPGVPGFLWDLSSGYCDEFCIETRRESNPRGSKPRSHTVSDLNHSANRVYTIGT